MGFEECDHTRRTKCDLLLTLKKKEKEKKKRAMRNVITTLVAHLTFSRV